MEIGDISRGHQADDWDPLSEQAVADPFLAQAELRKHCPFPYTSAQGGFRAVTRYSDIVQAALDTEHFKNGLKPKLPVPMPPLETDPPLHTAYRRLLQPHFLPARIKAIEDKLRGFTISILDPLLDDGEAEFVDEFTSVLPVRAFSELLNLPEEDWPRIRELSRDAFTIYAHVPERRAAYEAANSELYAYARSTLADRRASPRDPSEDIVSALAQGVINDRPISDEHIVGVVRLLLTAGHESTASALGNAVLYLAKNPDEQQRLRDNPLLIPAAIEELLRWDTPVMAMPRVVQGEPAISGHQFEEGEYVYLMYSSGNRDAEKFDRADECVLERKPNPHLAFGHGIHTCMGAPLARIELKVAIEELLKRTKNFELGGDPVRTVFHRRGLLCLPLRFCKRIE